MITGGDELFEPKQPSLWHNRDYTLLLSGQAVSRIGSQISQIAAPLLLYGLTGSAALTGLLYGTVIIPTLLLSLVAGGLMDRWNRKRTMIVCDLLRFAALGSIPLALSFGKLTPLQLFVASLVEGTGAVFFSVAELASFPNVIEPEQLDAAGGQQQAVGNVATTLGPLLAGILLSIGRAVPFALDAISYLISVVSLLFIGRPFQVEREAPRTTPLHREIREGLSRMWQDQILRVFVLCSSVSNGLDNALYVVFVVIAAQRLHAPTYAIGIVFALMGSGGIVGALLASRLKKLLGVYRLTCSNLWLYTLLLPLLLIVPNVGVLGVVACVQEFLLVANGTSLYVTRQAMIPQDLQGRVSSIFFLMNSLVPLGCIWGIGLLIQWAGTTVGVLVLTGIAGLLALVVTWSPALRHPQRRPITPQTASQ